MLDAINPVICRRDDFGSRGGIGNAIVELPMLGSPQPAHRLQIASFPKILIHGLILRAVLMMNVYV